MNLCVPGLRCLLSGIFPCLPWVYPVVKQLMVWPQAGELGGPLGSHPNPDLTDDHTRWYHSRVHEQSLYARALSFPTNLCSRYSALSHTDPFTPFPPDPPSECLDGLWSFHPCRYSKAIQTHGAALRAAFKYTGQALRG